MVTEGREMLREANVDPDSAGVGLVRAMDLRHKGQGYELTVEIPADLYRRGTMADLAAFFYDRYRDKYGHAHTNLPVELITCRVSLAGPTPEVPRETSRASSPDGAGARKGTRPVYFPEAGRYVDTPVFDRYRLASGTVFDGPAVIEERECTVVAGPSCRVRVDPHANLFLDLTHVPAATPAGRAGG
jgi:N-methylhydantoinase A